MGSKMLVIEDDLSLVPLWGAITRRNFGASNLDWAVSAEEGRRLFQASVDQGQPYALIVADLFLAGSETGLDFIHHARAAGLKTPILLVSAVAEEDLVKSFDESMHPVLVMTKPLNVPKCEKTLSRIFHEIERAQPLRGVL